MRFISLAATVAAIFPSLAAAQGWELRAGLERVSAMVCTEAGACFGIQCTATGGWRASWVVQVEPLGEAAVPDPIVGIRLDGERFALTDLSAAGAADGATQYTGPVANGDNALLDALQSGVSITVDPGRDFTLTEFSLRGSRWAILEATALCSSGGPDVFLPEEGTEGTADQ